MQANRPNPTRHPLSCLALALAVSSLASLSGCADMKLPDIQMPKLNLPQVSTAGTGGLGGAATRKGIAGTELEGLFSKHPITDSRNPERFPRIAITIHSATPHVYDSHAIQNTLTANDCITYDVHLWRSATEDKRFENLTLCANEAYQRAQGVPMYQVSTWGRRQYWPGDKNTGAVRGDGPTPPIDLFPAGAQYQNVWLDGMKNGIFFIGALFTELGYDWNQVYDKRIWFVSVPTR